MIGGGGGGGELGIAGGEMARSGGGGGGETARTCATGRLCGPVMGSSPLLIARQGTLSSGASCEELILW